MISAKGAESQRRAVYGEPPDELWPPSPRPRQLSPLIPGAEDIVAVADASLEAIVAAAPPGTLERRFVLAQALRALAPGGELTAVAPSCKGGARLRRELEAFGCEVAESYRRRLRICVCRRPEAPLGLSEAIEAGGPQRPPALGLWSQPGVFSWDRLDPGTAALLPHLADLEGAGADLGCGVGVLALRLLGSPAVTRLLLVDIDARAVAAAKRNVQDPRAGFLQADLGAALPEGLGLDFIAMNPPFHAGAVQDQDLGRLFVRRAAEALRPGGRLRLVANVALPYERALRDSFTRVDQLERTASGYKVLEAAR